MMRNSGRPKLGQLVLGLVLAAALLVPGLTPVLAEGLVVGTEVRVIAVDTEFSIVAQTEDFVLEIGGGQELRAAASRRVKSWKWEVSRDGGKTWQTVSTGAACRIDSARTNRGPDGRDVPYQYRVTAVSEYGETAAAVVMVLVSDEYDYRTIPQGGVSASGYLHRRTDLSLARQGQQPSAAADLLRSRLWPGYKAGELCTLALENDEELPSPYFGDVQLDFAVGSRYEAMTLRVLCCRDDSEVVEYTATVRDGVLSITVDALGTFLVELPQQPEGIVRIEVPEGGEITITVEPPEHGTVLPEGSTTVTDSQELEIYPDEGYTTKSVVVNGQEHPMQQGQLTLPEVTDDLDIRVDFTPAPVPAPDRAEPDSKADAVRPAPDCSCLWEQLFGECRLCRWLGRCVEPWCGLLPLLALAVLCAAVRHVLHKKHSRNTEK